MTGNRRWVVLSCAGLWALVCVGQGKEARKEATGAVMGHVYCADTNAPARLASVMLQPIEEVPEEASKVAEKDAAPDGAANGVKVRVKYRIPDSFEMSIVQTSLDGSFTIEKVKPGTYYVVVQKPGYLSPPEWMQGGRFTPEDLESMEKALHRITVESNQTVQVEERIERGAAISGTVSFDDGSPVAGLYVQLLRKDKDGKWEETGLLPNGSGSSPMTDDLGHFRLPGLPAAEYAIRVGLQRTESTMTKSGSSSTGGGGAPLGSPLYFFSGGTTRKKDAASFKLGAGEERAEEDIVIPLSKLHRVTGTLIAARDGHAINAGSLSLSYRDGTMVAEAEPDPDKREFNFEFVPEGDYMLSVPYAFDVVMKEDPLHPGQFNAIMADGTDLQNTPGRTLNDLQLYGYKEMPVSVKGDTLGLVVSMPDKTPAPVGGAAAGATAPH